LYTDLLKRLRPLLHAGWPIRDAIESLSQPPAASRLAKSLLPRLQSGSTFGEALESEAPRVPFAHALVLGAAERAGKLVPGIDGVLADLEVARELRRTLVSQTAYPFLVLLLALLLPPLYLVVQGKPGEYVAFQAKVFLPLLLVAASIGAWIYLRRRGGGGERVERIERFLLALPGVKRWVFDRAVGRALGLLGALVEAGLPLSESLPIAGRASGWALVRREFEGAERRLGTGATLAEALALGSVVPAELVGRLTTGEKAGALDRVLKELGEELRSRSIQSLQVALRVFPVVLYLVVGALVLFQMLAVFGAVAGRL
jgi:type II secretory pathway component PulF